MTGILNTSLEGLGILLKQEIFSYLCYGVLCFGLIYMLICFIRRS